MPRVTITPSGNLDLENDLFYVKPGDYRDALDVSPISDGDGKTISFEPVKGTSFYFDLNKKSDGSQSNYSSPQAKIYNIRLKQGAGQSYEIQFARPNNTLIGSTITFINDPSALTTISNAQAAISAELTVAVGAGNFFVTQDLSNVAVTVSIFNSISPDANGWEYSCYNTGAGDIGANIVVTQEAIDSNMIGDFMPIGSFDALGDLIVYSTNVKSGIKTQDIQGISSGIAGVIYLSVPGHGIKPGESVIVQGSTNNSGQNIDGEWIAFPVDQDTVSLFSSVFSGTISVTGATIKNNIYSLSQISAVTIDVIDSIVTHYSLLVSKELNLRADFRVHNTVEKEVDKLSLYFTDNLNPIRSMYYYKQYVDNGFINSFNPSGAYQYGTIDVESRLILSNTSVSFDFVATRDSGGQLKSGNHRYSIRFLTQSESPTDWMDLDQPINVYSALQAGPPAFLRGDEDGTITTKVNEFFVSNVPVGVFKYIELLDVNYVEDSYIAFIVKREAVSSSSFTIQHTGFEAVEPFDAGLINQRSAQYKTARSVDVLDNRLIISNLTTPPIPDLAPFFESWEHEITREEIDSSGGSAGSPYSSVSFGEYFNPANTREKKTFIFQETYRFGARVKLKNGSVLQNVFWIDDIRIDTDPINQAAPVNRRVSGLPDWDISNFVSAANDKPYVIKVNFSNINWEYDVNGIRLKDLVEEIYIDIVEMSEQYREVLASGFLILGSTDTASLSVNAGNAPDHDPVFGINVNLGNPAATATPWPFTSGMSEATGYEFPNLISYGSGFQTRDYIGFLYSNDIEFGETSISFQAGDRVDCLNALSTYNDYLVGSYGAPNGCAYRSHHHPMRFGSGHTDWVSTPLDGASFISGNQAAGFTGIDAGLRQIIDWKDNTGNTYSFDWYHAPALAVRAANPFQGFFDGYPLEQGVLYAQYYRDKSMGVKFGAKELSKYIPTGAIVSVSQDNIDVFGDSFVQKTYKKVRYNSQRFTPTSFSSPYFKVLGWGFGIETMLQNRVNFQMQYALSGRTIVPEKSPTEWLEEPYADLGTNSGYTNGYDNRNDLSVSPAYNPNSPDNFRFPTRVAYSEKKPNGSPVDNYRTFLPLNFRDLDLIGGEIVHHCVSNGELITWQKRSFQRQYFNSNGLLTSADNTQIVIGDGGALTRRGLQISSIGCSNKWSIVRGRSRGGNDVMAWVNTEYGYIIRFGYDGTVPISYVHNVRGFIKKNTNLAEARDSYDENIVGVWDDTKNEYVWTIRAIRANSGEWDPWKVYLDTQVGTTVYLYDGGQMPKVFRLIAPSSYNQNPLDPLQTDWQEVSDPSYFNAITIAYNDLKGGFSNKYTTLPRLYMKWRDGYLSSKYSSANQVHRHFSGVWSTFYDDIISDPYIELICAPQPDLKKDFLAVEINAESLPSASVDAMQFRTEQHYSYLKQSDFVRDELHDNMPASWIKNDATVSADNPGGVNDADTSSLFGNWLLAKFVFQRQAYNKLFGIVVKVNPRTRSNEI